MDIPENVHTSTEIETRGFDLSAGKTWIYPENFPLRDYQYNIVQTALYNNTLVCLPTGLGKTFIAAVIMFNFWRWYPRGKVIFLAPTRPLVAQQIDACHNTMGIPSAETVELTGAVNKKQREIIWIKKRVIFATPQIFQNDLENNIVPNDLIKCVVIDEAHKALGRHSYCECIRLLSIHNQFFRVLALSATPGNKLDNVHEVVQNLHISNIELRDETSSDILPYINQRKIDIILVPLGDDLMKYKNKYINIMDRHVRLLNQFNIIRTQTANISKGRVFYLLKQFQQQTDRSANHGKIMKTLNILLTMYHAYELLVRHGLRAFYKFYQNHSDKFWLNEEFQLRELLEDIRSYLGVFPDIQLSSSNIPEIPQDLVFGHNKFHKLKELLLNHFEGANNSKADTRAIVFVEYRDIVNEVYVLLLQSRPLIRPQMFVGQAGQKQKQQIKALEDFRCNRVNVLISTSIGEEGLDVGEVDLIICFDISQQSPTRLVQRMGRTGRKRDGHIIVLVTDGKENQTLKSTMARRDSLNNKILNTSNVHTSLYKNNPRMVPNEFTPTCHKMTINILPRTPVVKGKGRKNGLEKKNVNTKAKNEKNVKSNSENKNEQQGSLTKFLTSKKVDTVVNVNASAPVSIPNNTAQRIMKPSNVKLLSHDNEAIDFLTLCAIKKSETNVPTETYKKIDDTYMHIPPLISDFFNFEIPDIKILDCLATLTIKSPVKSPSENNHVQDDDINDYQNDIFDDNIWYSTRPQATSQFHQEETSANLSESKFEDLLDDSTDSDKTMIKDDIENNLNLNEFTDIPEVLNSWNEKQDNVNENSFVATDMLDLTEPGIFEDILDESSSEECINSPEPNAQSIETGDKNGICHETTDNTNTLNKKYSDTTHIENIKCNSNESTDYFSSHIKNGKISCINTDNSKQNSDINNLPTSSNNCIGRSSSISPMKVDADKSESNSSLDASMLTISQALKLIARATKNQCCPKETNENTIPDKQNEIIIKPNETSAVEVIDLSSGDEMFDIDINEEVLLKSEQKQSKETTINPSLHSSNTTNHLLSADKRKSKGMLFDDDWNSDFETFDIPDTNFVSTEQKENNSTVNKLQKIDKFKQPATISTKTENADSCGWIDMSFKKNGRMRNSNEKGTERIAKKLSLMKNSQSITNTKTNKTDYDSEDDFIVDPDELEKINVLESSFFQSTKYINDSCKTSMPTAQRPTNKNILSLKKDLHMQNQTSMPSTSSRNIDTRAKINGKESKSHASSDKNLSKDWRERFKDDIEMGLTYFETFDDGKSSGDSDINEDFRNSKKKSSKDCASKEKYKKKVNNFIDDEAEVSLDASTDNESSGGDEDLEGFISYTQDMNVSENMKAHYLQTVRSPVKKPGAFVFKEPKPENDDIDIYSQEPPLLEESYLHDSFCVAEEEDEQNLTKQAFGYSILEEAEKILKQKRKRRVPSSDRSEDTVNKVKKKRRKVYTLNSSISSEDEMDNF